MPPRRFRPFLHGCLLVGGLAARAALAQTDVLFVGNSFTNAHYEPAASYNNSAITDVNGTDYGGVPGIFKKLTVQANLDYNVTIDGVSSQSLTWQYLNKAPIIGQAKWDAVVFQEQSFRPTPISRGGDPGEFEAAVAGLEKLVLDANPAAKTFLYETYAYPSLVYPSGTSYYGSSLATMQSDLQAGYFSAQHNLGLTGVARAGDAYLEAVNRGFADGNPYDGIASGTFDLWGADNRHPSKYGAYLCAAVIFAKLTLVDPRTLSTGSDSAAFGLGISAADAQRLNLVAYEVNALADLPPPSSATPPPLPNLLQPNANVVNWNAEASWKKPLVGWNAVLVDAQSAPDSIVATSMDGATGHPASVQTVSFDIGSTTKNVQANATVTTTRVLRLTGGMDALSGTDLIHLSSTTTGTANMGTNSGLGLLSIVLTTDGSFNVENAAGTLNLGATAVVSGDFNLTKSGDGKLTLSGANTFGSGKVFTVQDGVVLANTAVSGANSATGASAVTVAGAGMLGGTGQITPGVGSKITVLQGGTIAPGVGGIGTLTINGQSTTAGILSMSEGSRFVFDLQSGSGNRTSDRLVLLNGAAGDFAFGGVLIDFNDLSSGTLLSGAYLLFAGTNPNQFAGLTTDGNGIITDGLEMGNGLENYVGSTLQIVGNNIVVNVVPEPSAFLLAIGSLGVMGWRPSRTRGFRGRVGLAVAGRGLVICAP